MIEEKMKEGETRKYIRNDSREYERRRKSRKYIRNDRREDERRRKTRKYHTLDSNQMLNLLLIGIHTRARAHTHTHTRTSTPPHSGLEPNAEPPADRYTHPCSYVQYR